MFLQLGRLCIDPDGHTVVQFLIVIVEGRGITVLEFLARLFVHVSSVLDVEALGTYLQVRDHLRCVIETDIVLTVLGIGSIVYIIGDVHRAPVGVVHDDAALIERTVLREFVDDISGGYILVRDRVDIDLPADITEVEFIETGRLICLEIRAPLLHSVAGAVDIRSSLYRRGDLVTCDIDAVRNGSAEAELIVITGSVIVIVLDELLGGILVIHVIDDLYLVVEVESLSILDMVDRSCECLSVSTVIFKLAAVGK